MRRRRLLRAHRSPLREVLESRPYWGVGHFPILARRHDVSMLLQPPSCTEAKAEVTTEFSANLRHAAGATLLESAWTGLTPLQHAQFTVLSRLIQSIPSLVRAIVTEDPTQQRQALQFIELTTQAMEELTTIEEEVWQIVREG